MKRAPPEIRSLIDKEANEYGLDPDFVEAVYLSEEGAPNQMNWDVRHFAHGPMQVSLAAATDFGFDDSDKQFDSAHASYKSPTLATSAISVKYGTAYLAKRGVKVGCSPTDLGCLLASYNGGSPNINPATGQYRNQQYVTTILNRLSDIKGGVTGYPHYPSGGSGPTGPGSPGGGGSGVPPAPNSGSINYAFPCSNLNKEEFDSTILPRSPCLPWFTILYKTRSGAGPWMDFTVGPEGRPRWVTYFEFHEKLADVSTARIRLFDESGDVLAMAAIGEGSALQVDTVGNAAPATNSGDVSQFALTPNVLDTALLGFGYMPSSAESGTVTNTTLDSVLSFIGAITPERTKLDAVDRIISPIHRMHLHNYQPNFRGWGVEMDLTFMNALGSAATEQRTVAYPSLKIASGHVGGVPTAAPSGQSLGIIETICKERGWSACTQETNMITSLGGDQTGVTETQRTIIQAGTDDRTFINSILCAQATVVGSNIGGFLSNLDSSTEPPTLHFHPPVYNNPTARTYVYGRSRHGVVISFSVVVQGELIVLFGGGSLMGISTDTARKSLKTLVSKSDGEPVGMSNASNGVQLSSHIKMQGRPTVDGQQPNVDTIKPISKGSLVDQVQTDLEASRQMAEMASVTAQMVIIGDPLIKPGMSVNVIIQTGIHTGMGPSISESMLGNFSSGALGGMTSLLGILNDPAPAQVFTQVQAEHYASGSWQVMEARHVIQGGEYLTYLELFRNRLFGQSIYGDTPRAANNGQTA